MKEHTLRVAMPEKSEMSSNQEQKTVEWLMQGDPAIRWQTMRDLLECDQDGYQRERLKVADNGWGARYLSYQEANGLWGAGIYSPKWISTTYTMLTLRRIGVPADNQQVQKGCQLLLERGFYQDGGINYFQSYEQSEACVTGMVLSVLSFFRYPDARKDDLADHLLGRQMPDGGWNCMDYRGDTHSSFHTTISVLEGLLEYQRSGAEVSAEVESTRLRAHEFLLQHRLYKSHRTGEVVNVRMQRMPFPPRWFYDFLRALDYFQDYYKWRSKINSAYPDPESEQLDRAHQRDERFSDGIELLISKEKADGRWNMMRGPSGKVYFDMEQAGKSSRWNTLRALRVLKWWEGAQ